MNAVDRAREAVAGADETLTAIRRAQDDASAAAAVADIEAAYAEPGYFQRGSRMFGGPDHRDIGVWVQPMVSVKDDPVDDPDWEHRMGAWRWDPDGDADEPAGGELAMTDAAALSRMALGSLDMSEHFRQFEATMRRFTTSLNQVPARRFTYSDPAHLHGHHVHIHVDEDGRVRLDLPVPEPVVLDDVPDLEPPWALAGLRGVVPATVARPIDGVRSAWGSR